MKRPVACFSFLGLADEDKESNKAEVLLKVCDSDVTKRGFAKPELMNPSTQSRAGNALADILWWKNSK